MQSKRILGKVNVTKIIFFIDIFLHFTIAMK